MKQYGWFFRQKITGLELTAGFDAGIASDEALATDAGFGIASGAAVTAAGTPNLTVLVSPGVIYDKTGKRAAWTAQQIVNVAVDSSNVTTAVSAPGTAKVISIFAKYTRALQTPRIDGNGDTQYFEQLDAVEFVVVQGAEAALPTPPALDAANIHIADIVREYGQTTIAAGDIATIRTNVIPDNENFAAWENANTTHVAAAGGTPPVGPTIAATQLKETAVNDAHGFFRSVTNPWQGQTARVACSVYVKAGTRTWVVVGVDDHMVGTPRGVYAWFNLGAGTIGTLAGSSGTESDLAAFIEDVGSGWFRCTVMATAAWTQTALLTPFLFLGTGDEGWGYLGVAGNVGAEWDGVQIERAERGVRHAIPSTYEKTGRGATPIVRRETYAPSRYAGVFNLIAPTPTGQLGEVWQALDTVGQPYGFVPLNSSAKIPPEYLPPLLVLDKQVYDYRYDPPHAHNALAATSLASTAGVWTDLSGPTITLTGCTYGERIIVTGYAFWKNAIGGYAATYVDMRITTNQAGAGVVEVPGSIRSETKTGGQGSTFGWAFVHTVTVPGTLVLGVQYKNDGFGFGVDKVDLMALRLPAVPT